MNRWNSSHVLGKLRRLTSALRSVPATVPSGLQDAWLAAAEHIVLSGPAGIVTLRENGTISSFNQEAERLFGYQAAEVVGRPVHLLVPEPLRPDHVQHLANFARDKKSHILGIRREVRGLRKDGSIFPLDLHVNAIDVGREKVFVGFVSDITERCKARRRLNEANAQLAWQSEEMARLRREAESASRAKSKILLDLSHALQRPLTNMMICAELLDAPALDQAHRHEMIGALRQDGQHVLDLVNQVLILARIEAEQIGVELIPSSPGEIVDEVIVEMESLAAEKHLTLQGTAAGPLPASIITDPVRVKEILFGLLHNAIKFTSSGGVTLSLRWERRIGKCLLHFDVADTGIGIPDDRLGTIFESFPASSVRPAADAGLTLAIGRKMARRLGGDLTVQSTPGQGSCFTLTIDPGPPCDETDC